MTNAQLGCLLPSNSVHVWTVTLACSGAISDSGILSNQEKSKIGRFVHDRDRQRYIASHLALRQILAGYSGVRPEQIWFHMNEFGKPSLGNYPQIEFNMSHSGAIALIAVRVAGSVGIDVEEIRSEPPPIDVAKRFFSQGELERLHSLREDEQLAGFLRCWTRKEAYLKAVGCGISDEDLATVEVTLLADEPPAVLRRAARDKTTKPWSVFHLEPVAGFIAAVVAEGTGLQLLSKSWPEGLPQIRST